MPNKEIVTASRLKPAGHRLGESNNVYSKQVQYNLAAVSVSREASEPSFHQYSLIVF